MSRSPESVEPHAELEQLEPLFCIGESHCLRFRGRLYRRPGRTRPLVAHVHFLKDVEATTFTGDGGLHPAVAAALLAAGVLVERPSDDDDAEAGVELEPAHRATTFRRRVLAARHAALADEPLVAPAILLFAGDKELHGLACELDGADFELPQADFEPSRGGGVTRVPFHAVEAAFAARLRPFFDGLAMLREAG
ncbi:MAG: hypothetical protein KDE27_09360, partial [Planctomycetes bacterium]|nr:hypothetical protein [Planctomycetota bacterium]